MMILSWRSAAAMAAMTLWAGAALFFAAFVARAAFAALPSRALAGALVGRLLPVVFLGGILVAVVAVALLLSEKASSRMPSIWFAAGVAVTSALAQFAVAPRIERVREKIGPALEALPAADPLRQSFGRLHALSFVLMCAGLVCAMLFVAFISVRAFRDAGERALSVNQS
jgi:hypothetical protein